MMNVPAVLALASLCYTGEEAMTNYITPEHAPVVHRTN